MAKLLKATDIIEKNLPKLSEKTTTLTQAGLQPYLSVILVGDNPASHSYVKNKRRMCEKIGANFKLTHLPENIPPEDFLTQVNEINNDPKVTGCFVQLPVPEQLKHIDVTQIINPKKDVDGFHLNTTCDLYLGNLNNVVPCTPKGIITMLQHNNISIEGKNITIVGRSHIVGKPLALILEALNGTVTLCHSRTKNTAEHCQGADIIISAVGKPKYLDENYISPNKNQILIDVGINKLDDKLVGDMDFDKLKEKVAAITPVPGGVGPMTVYSLMENLLLTTENILKENRHE